MSRPTWAKDKLPVRPKVSLPAGQPCTTCPHPRSSHFTLVLHGRCRATGCHCQAYDARCNCQHELSDHAWGTPGEGWPCSRCSCPGFNPGPARLDGHPPPGDQPKLTGL